eukprot:scaffold259468_cov16-Prasinocladus_malaysianus.AAC.3
MDDSSVKCWLTGFEPAAVLTISREDIFAISPRSFFFNEFDAELLSNENRLALVQSLSANEGCFVLKSLNVLLRGPGTGRVVRDSAFVCAVKHTEAVKCCRLHQANGKIAKKKPLQQAIVACPCDRRRLHKAAELHPKMADSQGAMGLQLRMPMEEAVVAIR